jgi:DNA modification methylase
VFEPFCGSGTTLVVAERLSRRCYATELSPRYAQGIIARWQKMTGRKAERAESLPV